MRKILLLTIVLLIAFTTAAGAVLFRSINMRGAQTVSEMTTFDTKHYSYLSKNGIIRDQKFTISAESNVTLRVYTENLAGSAAFFLETPTGSQLLGEGKRVDETIQIVLLPGDYSIMVDVRMAKAGVIATGVDNGI